MPKPQAGPDGWTDFIKPVMRGYRLACCDCGLVHDMDFKVVRIIRTSKSGIHTVADAEKKYEVLFRARRNYRSTAAMRKKRV
jgi:hypothetical protein